MSDSPLDLDLKLLPDWLKEPEGKNPYADYPGEPAGRGFRQGGRRPEGRSGPRPEGRGGPRPGPGRHEGGPARRDGGKGGRREGSHGGGRGPASGRPFRGREGREGGPGAARPERHGKSPFGEPREREAAPATPEATVPLEVVILPEPEAIAALTQQIRTSHRAYPLYGLGRMFLNKPERHRVRITSLAPAYPLYQIQGEGVTLNRRQAQKEAFRAALETHYTRETQESEPPKGNFTNVGRCRITGTLLGPTNHHGYQLALRRLYEARFARREDFQEFLRQIEVVSDPEVIEAWKKQVSTSTVYRTSQEAEPVEFATLEAVEAHFTAHYLDQCLVAAKTVEISGTTSRNLHDRVLREAIRAAWEKERTFPAQVVARLRPHFTEASLAVWKHRKRMLYVSDVRPTRFGAEARSVSEEIGGILNIIESKPKCTRADLSAQFLKPFEGDESHARRKTALAADFHWLIQSGHIIEFHDGTLDLPLPPREAAKEAAAGDGDEADVAAESTAAAEATGASTPADAQEPASEPVTAPEAATPAPAAAVAASVEAPDETPIGS